MSNIDELIKTEKVEWKKLGEIKEIKVISPKKKIKKQQYLEEGRYPIIDQGQNFIVGYTNDDDAIFEKGNYVIFGDHSEIVKYVDFQFAQGADGIKVMKTNEKYLNSRYLYHSILNFYEIKGNYMRHFSLLKDTQIPIPSIEIQEKIVEILDKYSKYVTELQFKLQSELNNRIKQYEYYRNMLLSEEHLSKMSKIPENSGGGYRLRFLPLGKIAEINRGASPRPISNFITESPDGVPWIKISDVEPSSKYILKTKQKITKEGAKKSRLLKKGDFIISNSMSYGRPYILGIEGCIHDGWASISGYNGYMNSDFLYHYLSSDKVQRYWRNKMNTASVSNLNSEIIKSLPIPILNLELQVKISKVLDKFQSLLSETKGLIPKEIELRQKQYEYYREQLLSF